MKIIAFGASYSKHSINKEFAGFVAEQFKQDEVEILDLNDFKVPLFTVDVEAEIGIPQEVNSFINKVAEADFLIISMAEHNGSYTAAFKSLFDWASRSKSRIFEGKKLLLLSASIGPRGASSVLEAARIRFPRHGAEIIATFSLPNFQDNYAAEKGILNEELDKKFKETISFVQNSFLV